MGPEVGDGALETKAGSFYLWESWLERKDWEVKNRMSW